MFLRRSTRIRSTKKSPELSRYQTTSAIKKTSLFNQAQMSVTNVFPTLDSIWMNLDKPIIAQEMGENFIQCAVATLENTDDYHGYDQSCLLDTIRAVCQLDKNNAECTHEDYESYVMLYRNIEEALETAIKKHMNWRSEFKDKLNKMEKTAVIRQAWLHFLDPDKGIAKLKWDLLNKIKELQPLHFEFLVTRDREISKEKAYARLREKQNQTIRFHPLTEIECKTEIQALQAIIHPHLAMVVVINRSVAAVEILQKAKEQGRGTALICGMDDSDSLITSLPDEVHYVNLGQLDQCMEAVLRIKQRLPAGYPIGVHPGYGLHAENAALPVACEKMGVIFIGPCAQAMQELGSKQNARIIAKQHNVPVIPGYDGENQDRDHLTAEAKAIGFPVIVKTIDGGGGTGNRVANTEEELNAIFQIFTGTVVLEKYIKETHQHIEVQLLINTDGVIALGFRNCSIQRNDQKYIELALSKIENGDKLKEYALALGNHARESGYTGAGTVEFIVTKKNMYFLEVNPRLQVEHAVTEDIYDNFSIIGAQFNIAEGMLLRSILSAKLTDSTDDQSLQAMADDLHERSHHKSSIQARVNAVVYLPYEDKIVMAGVQGTITHYQEPNVAGRGALVSSVGYASRVNTLDVNPNIAIIRAHGAEQTAAIHHLCALLDEYEVQGIETNKQHLSVAIDELKAGAEINNDTSKRINETFDEQVQSCQYTAKCRS